MVKHIFFTFLLLPMMLCAGSFTATVSNAQVGIGEPFTLALVLKDASPKGNPTIDQLKAPFLVHSQLQSSSTMFNNGQVSSTLTWTITMASQKEGETLIPSISIETTEGTLTTEPLTIRVVKEATKTLGEDADVTLKTEISQTKPYKNEPVLYTAKLISKLDLANIRMQNFEVADAIVEAYGEPKVTQQIVDGTNFGVIEFNYLITPLKPGPLKIPAISIQGVVPSKRKTSLRSLFDNSGDPFSFMHGLDRFKPFSQSSDELTLDVQQPVAGENPWLPAKSLKIEEIWEEPKTLQVGEPITRKLRIVADGIKSTQLPSLGEQHQSDGQFKIYADKPETGDQLENGIHSFRKEQYTIIPVQAGTLTLPEISITWWDVVKKERAVARIPARTLQVLAAPGSAPTAPTTSEKGSEPVAATPIVIVYRDPILYGVIILLILLLAVVVFWALRLRKRIVQLENTPLAIPKKAPSPVKKSKKETLPELNPT